MTIKLLVFFFQLEIKLLVANAIHHIRHAVQEFGEATEISLIN